MRAKGEDRHKLLAVLLHDEFKYSQIKIAEFLGIAPSTVSSWINTGRFLRNQQNYEQTISQLKEELKANNILPLPDLEEIDYRKF